VGKWHAEWRWTTHDRRTRFSIYTSYKIIKKPLLRVEGKSIFLFSKYKYIYIYIFRTHLANMFLRKGTLSRYIYRPQHWVSLIRPGTHMIHNRRNQERGCLIFSARSGQVGTFTGIIEKLAYTINQYRLLMCFVNSGKW